MLSNCSKNRKEGVGALRAKSVQRYLCASTKLKITTTVFHSRIPKQTFSKTLFGAGSIFFFSCRDTSGMCRLV